MKITVRTAIEILHHEGLCQSAYKDSVGVWTWGVGVTNASGHNVMRYKDSPQPMAHCLKIYLWLAEKKYAPAVRRAFKGSNLTEAQFAAALSFHWNTGAIGKASWVKKWKKGDVAGARKAFMNWTTPKSITARRKAERDLFFNGKWSNHDGRIPVYPVSKRYSPIWGRRKMVNVNPEVRALLAGQAPKAPDVPKPNPAQQPRPPIDAPAAQPAPPQKRGLLKAFVDLVLSLFGKRA